MPEVTAVNSGSGGSAPDCPARRSRCSGGLVGISPLAGHLSPAPARAGALRFARRPSAHLILTADGQNSLQTSCNPGLLVEGAFCPPVRGLTLLLHELLPQQRRDRRPVPGWLMGQVQEGPDPTGDWVPPALCFLCQAWWVPPHLPAGPWLASGNKAQRLGRAEGLAWGQRSEILQREVRGSFGL